MTARATPCSASTCSKASWLAERESMSAASTLSPSTCSNPPGLNASRRNSQSGFGSSGSGSTCKPSSRISSSLSWRRPCFHAVYR
ncbi:hypothetical protein [Brachybacterium sacelli]|uniref:hypothetical protein n=1 Tax=Brachybacterium sacelli TaxID=173364 RepID=UPI003609304F